MFALNQSFSCGAGLIPRAKASSPTERSAIIVIVVPSTPTIETLGTIVAVAVATKSSEARVVSFSALVNAGKSPLADLKSLGVSRIVEPILGKRLILGIGLNIVLRVGRACDEEHQTQDAATEESRCYASMQS